MEIPKYTQSPKTLRPEGIISRELIENTDSINFVVPSIIKNFAKLSSNFQKTNPSIKNICSINFKNPSTKKERE
jgi:hypothetical protein